MHQEVIVKDPADSAVGRSKRHQPASTRAAADTGSGELPKDAYFGW